MAFNGQINPMERKFIIFLTLPFLMNSTTLGALKNSCFSQKLRAVLNEKKKFKQKIENVAQLLQLTADFVGKQILINQLLRQDVFDLCTWVNIKNVNYGRIAELSSWLKAFSDFPFFPSL